MKRMIVQISAMGDGRIGVVALANDGSLWWLPTQTASEWRRLPSLPDETDAEQEARLASRRALAEELSRKLSTLQRKGV